MWGNARKSAGQAKSPGKKKDTSGDTSGDCSDYCLDLISLHKEFHAAENRFSLHEEFRAAGGGDVDEIAIFIREKRFS